jgi:hypothetical protein
VITILTHSMAGFVGIVVGAYGWYRWGSSVKSDVQKIATELSTFGNKPSGK